MHAEVAVRGAGERAHHRRARCVGIGGRARKSAHRRLRERKQVGQDVAIADAGDLGHPPRLQQVGLVVVGGDIDRRGLTGAAGGVVHLPQRAFMQGQVGAVQAKRLGLRHQVLFGRQRQRFKVVDVADVCRVDAGLRPAASIVGVALGAQRHLAGHQRILDTADFGQRLAQEFAHRPILPRDTLPDGLNQPSCSQVSPAQSAMA